MVVNRFDPNLQGFGTDRSKQVLAVKSKSIDTIADDRAVPASINAGMTLRASGRSTALTDIARLAKKIDASRAGTEAKPAETTGWFARTFGLARGVKA